MGVFFYFGWANYSLYHYFWINKTSEEIGLGTLLKLKKRLFIELGICFIFLGNIYKKFNKTN